MTNNNADAVGPIPIVRWVPIIVGRRYNEYPFPRGTHRSSTLTRFPMSFINSLSSKVCSLAQTNLQNTGRAILAAEELKRFIFLSGRNNRVLSSLS
jgi:hypothetical protein